MTFHEVRLPEDVERGAQGGPRFKTTVLTLSSGHERRNIDWSQSRAEYDIGYGIQTKADLQAVISFFYARKGRAIGFRFKDWADYQVNNQFWFTGTGSGSIYQLSKTYQDAGSFTFIRELNKIVAGSLVVRFDTVITTAYTVDLNTGLVTFNSPVGSGVVVTFDVEFDVPVRFDTDKLDVSVETFDAAAIPSIPVIELRV